MSNPRCFVLILLIVLSCRNCPVSAADLGAMQVFKTKQGTRFGLFGKRPESPGPTFFVFATSIEEMARERIYTTTGRKLAGQGWLYVTLDPPCHGIDQKKGEPRTLSGWAHRVKKGQDLMKPFVSRCRDVLDWLVAKGYTDPKRVAVGGTSRGGLCALHFMAAEPRVKAMVGISPVTNVLALREFSGVKRTQVKKCNAAGLANQLAGRAIWISIGNDDKRVSTDDCIATTRRFVAAARKKYPNANAPIELVIAPSKGHTNIDRAYERGAAFVLKQMRR